MPRAGDPNAGKIKTCRKGDGGCGRRFYVPKGSRRERCEECAPPRVRSRADDVVVQIPSVVDALVEQAQGQRVVGALEAATLRELRARDREASPQGVAALLAARELEGRTHSGSQFASLMREFRDALSMALKGAPRERDALDDLEARRLQRAGRGA